MDQTAKALHDIFVERKGVPVTYDYVASQMPFFGKLYSMRDNAHYWEDYVRNTGYKPCYPGRTYSNGGVGQMFAEGTAFAENLKKIYG